MIDPFERYDADTHRLVGRVCRVVTGIWFRFHSRGWEYLPPPPALIVGNHSGTGVADVLCMLGAASQELPESRATGLMSDPLIKSPLIGTLFSAAGAVAASQENARRALELGHYVLVYPGGELDSMRPFYRPRDVVFEGRRGYARLALETGVPVVPLATLGSHWTYPMLPGGKLLARLARRFIRGDRHPIPYGVVPLGIAAAGSAAGLWTAWWILAAAATIFILLPARVTSEFLPAVDLDEARLADDPVERAHELVHGPLQAAVRGMSHRGR